MRTFPDAAQTAAKQEITKTSGSASPGPESNQAKSARPGAEFWVSAAALTLVYVLAVAVTGRRYLWFDELLTYGIVRASTLPHLWRMICNFDGNPPASYLLSRLSMAILGPGKWGLRMPSIVEFYLGSGAIFWYVRRHAGSAFAAFAVLMLWASGAFYYAVEARPYALLFMSCSWLLVGWDGAIRQRPEGGHDRRLSLSLVALASAGLFAAHAFGVFSLLPFLGAEAMRWRRRRRPDFALWAALLLPSLLMLSYIPLFETYQRVLFPHPFEASLPKLGKYFDDAFDPLERGLLLGLLAAVAAAPFGSARLKSSELRVDQLWLLSGFLLSPLALTLVLMHGHGAFWNRYGITAQAMFYAALAIFLGLRFQGSRTAGYCLALAMLLLTLHHDVLRPLRAAPRSNGEALLKVRPDLPIVDNSVLTFFEMNHYESPALLSRVYYLMDRPAAIQFAHSTAYEDFELPSRMKADFSISANVAPYRDFAARHRQFLVLGQMDYPEDWVLRKLAADGARIDLQGEYPSMYRDSTLYLVTMPDGR